MCVTCGCGDPTAVRVRVPNTLGGVENAPHAHAGAHVHDPHDHDPHDHDPHDHDPNDHGDGRWQPADAGLVTKAINVEQELLAKNDGIADQNRAWLAERRITAVNLMSSPGSGKTTLLERTILETRGQRAVCVIEGDQETLIDAERIRATGASVVQVNTGAGCHLDADMVRRAMRRLAPPDGSLLLVENVGNLVCPALFNLGEAGKVVVISVTEGDDKVLKYPHMFATADLVLVNKTDLLPYVDFDVDRCMVDARSLNRGVEVLPLSAKSGAGMDAWYEWLQQRVCN